MCDQLDILLEVCDSEQIEYDVLSLLEGMEFSDAVLPVVEIDNLISVVGESSFENFIFYV